MDGSKPLAGRWQSIVCIASGPSLTAGDVECVHAWREKTRETAQGRGVIVTNTTYQQVPWADVVFGMDRQWWKTYLSDVMLHCTGYRYSNNHVAGTCYAELKGCGNSGAGAIALAAQWQARRIILLGYDGQHTGGKTHWHGDHPRHLGNAGSVHLWQKKFAELAKTLTAEVINATRETALTCWPRMTLETALALP